MNVELIAHTVFTKEYDEVWPFDDEEYLTTDSDWLAEFAGRACYQSWDKPNPKTRANKDYLANIIRQQHFSVLEHGSATFYITGVSRNLTHELIRHRHLSFSEVSQRYVDVSTFGPVDPPLYVERDFSVAGWGGEATYTSMVRNYETSYDVWKGMGYSRKEAREAARCELPSSMETRIVVTGNHRSWREVLEKRGSLAADREIRELVVELYTHLQGIAPGIYQDFKREWDEDKGCHKLTRVTLDSESSSVESMDHTVFMRAVMTLGESVFGMTPQDIVAALSDIQK